MMHIQLSFKRLREALVPQVDQVSASLLPAGKQVWE